MDNSQPQIAEPDDHADDRVRNASGIWTLTDDRLASVEDFDDGPSVVLVHSENVLLLRVELPPIASLAKRRAALPFAIEDRIAEPLEKVHVALGEEIAPGVFLAAVVRHDLMRRWIARLDLAGLQHASLVPDALSLPRPGPGRWTVDQADMRVCVRAHDGTGFAMPVAMLEQAWKAAGEPDCVAYGEPLPPQMYASDTNLPADFTLQEQSLAKRLIAPALDLRQGLYAAPRRRMDALWKRIATIAAVGAVAHVAIAGTNVMALNDIAEEREAEVRLLAQNMQPPFPVDADLAVTVASLTPDGQINAPGQFLPLLTRVGSALANSQTPLTWRSVGFNSTAQTLSIEVEATDLAALQAASAALKASGLAVTPGAANNAQSAVASGTGGTVGNFIIRPR